MSATGAAPAAPPLLDTLRELGFDPRQIQSAVDAGCANAQEAVSFLYDRVPPAAAAAAAGADARRDDNSSGSRDRPRPINWDAPSAPESPAQSSNADPHRPGPHRGSSNSTYPAAEGGEHESISMPTLRDGPPEPAAAAAAEFPTNKVEAAAPPMGTYGDLRSDVGVADTLLSISNTNNTPQNPPAAQAAPASAAAPAAAPAAASKLAADVSQNPHSRGGLSWSAPIRDMLGLGGRDTTGSRSLAPGASSLPASAHKGQEDALSSTSGFALKTDGAPRAATQSVSFQEQQLSEEESLRKAIEISEREQHDRELQDALRLSKVEAESGRPATGDSDLMMAIQQSLRDAPNHADAWTAASVIDDPRDRRRTPDDAPVGLRNIGNTCYLNSLLQVYFNLPAFRRVILQYEPPPEILAALDEAKKEGQALKLLAVVPRPATPRQRAVASSPESLAAEPASDQISKLEEVPPNSPASTSGTMHSHMVIEDPPQPYGVAPRDLPQTLGTADLCAIEFVVELQRLFGKMCLGNEKFADPSALVRAMCDPNGKPIDIGGQQDASEFNSLFLDIVERAMSYEREVLRRSRGAEQSDRLSESLTRHPEGSPPSVDASASSPPSAIATPKTNIVKQMFSASFTQHVSLLERTATENVKEIPPICEDTIALVVDATSKSHRDLLHGLDDYMHAKIEYSVDHLGPSPGQGHSLSRRTLPALKSVWFTGFAPVLTVYLQRVRFNREKSQAEKVHDRFTFETEITVDRYLEQNRKASESARSVVDRIRAERIKTTSALRRLRCFPCDSNYARDRSDFGENPDYGPKRSSDPATFADIAMTDTDSAKGAAAQMSASMMCADDMQVVMSRVHERVRAALDVDNTKDNLFVVEGLDRESASTVLEFLERIDSHDQEQVLELERRLASLRKEELDAYKGFDKIRYLLQAVLIHDGAPSSGHYWTFIRNPSSSVNPWLKFNDTHVTEVSDEEMLLSSQGGQGFASAYCLIYVGESARSYLSSGSRSGSSSSSAHTAMDVDEGAMRSIREECREILPARCLAEVDASNAAFSKEIEAFERAKALNDCKRQAREIIEASVVALRRAETSLSGLPFSSTMSPSSTRATHSEGRSKQSSRVRTLVEFSLACGSHASALIHALAASWNALMPIQIIGSRSGLLDYLASPVHKFSAYPPLGSSAAQPDKERTLQPVEIVLQEMAVLLSASEASFPGDAAMLPRATAARIASLLRGSEHLSAELENAVEIMAHYKFAVRATYVASVALDASLVGRWVEALGAWLLIMRQELDLYDSACSGTSARPLLFLFKTSPRMAFARREGEAAMFLPSVLKAIYLVWSLKEGSRDDNSALDSFEIADYTYCRVSEIREILLTWQADESIGPAEVEGLPGKRDFNLHIMTCCDILSMFGPEFAANMDVKRKSSNDNLRIQLEKFLRVVNKKTGEEVAAEFEALRESMNDTLGHGGSMSNVLVANAAERLLERRSARQKFTPVA